MVIYVSEAELKVMRRLLLGLDPLDANAKAKLLAKVEPLAQAIDADNQLNKRERNLICG